MDLLDDDERPGAGGNTPEYTVAEISGAVKKTLEGTFGRIRVRGEVGRVLQARSGHFYYDIKDDRNVLNCTTWKGQVRGLGVTPEEGMEVVVTGKLSAYGPSSKYNMNVDSMEVAGAGALMAMLEKRRRKLADEGLFAAGRKQALPYLPGIIGVVTSPQGAVIRDILHRLRDRFPRKVLVWPVAVQGPDCAAQVAAAIRGFNALTPGGALPRPDLIIVARGGGSVEDLWGFNEEIVVRAAADSAIPLISAVGHETDTTLIDHAADRRAPTPTAAAEMAVPVRADLLAHVETLAARIASAQARGLDRRGQRLRDLARALPRPDSLLATPAQRLDMLERRLPAALTARVGREKLRLGQAAGALRPVTLRRALHQQSERLARLSDRAARAQSARLERLTQRLDALGRLARTLSYRATLERGFAVVQAGDALLTSAQAARDAGQFTITFADGALPAQALADPPRAARAKGPAPEG
jgi:exodeoxyribonuclease VII large subunit